MSHTITKLPNEPIVWVKMGADYNVQAEIEATARESNALFDKQTTAVFVIVDFSLASLDMQDILVGTSAAARGDNSPLHHPKVRQNIFVTTAPSLKMTAAGLKNPIFGELDIPVFETYEEALAYIRGKLKKG